MPTSPCRILPSPGSENAGTFNLDAQAFDTQSGSACTTITPGTTIPGVQAQRFSSTQDQTIIRQLYYGVRWIDLTVGYNGGGNPITGWRVVQNLYSNWPLSEYLDQVAIWAAFHPSEAVMVDLSTICYDHDPTPAIDRGLWANFAAKSAEGAGTKTIADVVGRLAPGIRPLRDHEPPAPRAGARRAEHLVAAMSHARRSATDSSPSWAR